MSKSRPKTMHYKTVASNDKKFNYQALVSDVLIKMPTMVKRTIIIGEKTIQCIKLKRSPVNGIYIHLTSFIEGEQASTIVKANQDTDLSVASAPEGEEFMDGDIHILISNNDLLFCSSGSSRENIIKDYFDSLCEEASMSRPEYVVKTPVRSQILKMLHSGVKGINLNAHATASALEKLNESSSRYLQPVKKIVEALTLKERTLEEIGGLDGLMFGIHINSKGRIDPDSDAQTVMQEAGKGIIEDEIDGFSIETRDGSKITHDSISYKHKKYFEKFGKTIVRSHAWDALTEFRNKLVEQGVIKA